MQAKHPQSANPVGFVVSDGKESVYHAGDTYDTQDLTNVQIDTALIPIGGTFTMDIIGAITALKRMRAKNVIPMHYNTFSKIIVNPEEFAKRVRASTKTNPVILKPGENIRL